jgi:NodT family efflux transporter outer membrane factor (OMF) lipoprotein
MARQRDVAQVPGETEFSSAGSVGLGVSYEVDVFGRVRESVRAATHRLAARTAEVQNARLLMVAQIAEGVVALRACEFSRRLRAIDIDSRKQVLDLTRLRVAAGVDARAEESRARNSLAAARTEAALLDQECERWSQALFALTGVDCNGIRSAVRGEISPEGDALFMPVAPELPALLPARVLAEHPALVTADREAAAAWSDAGAARAARLPRIDLAAVLTGNWLRAAGSTADISTWSFGAGLVAPLFDGRAGASNAHAADARYRASIARLRQAVRVVVQDVELALAFATASRLRLSSSDEALVAARETFQMVERRWRAGVTSLFELEDARRQRVMAEDAAVAATRDHAQAWIAVIESLGVSTPVP